jgi:hypothetical protein
MKTLRTIFLMLLVLETFSQEQVNYKVVADEPRKINNFSCNIDLAQMDAGFSNIDGLSFNTGVYGHAMYKQKMGIDYTFRYGWLTLGKAASKDIKNHLNFQLGGFFILTQRDPITTNKVILKVSGSTNRSGQSVTTTTYLMVPSHKWKYTAVRGGLYFNRGGYRIKNELGADNFGNAYIFGVYGGLCFGTAKQVLIQTDSYGAKGNVGHIRVCLDALITPLSNAPATGLKTLPIGGRLLVQALPTLQKKSRKNKFRTPMTAEFEVGYRSIAGIYIAGTLSIPISRSIKALASKEEDQTIKRTTE